MLKDRTYDTRLNRISFHAGTRCVADNGHLIKKLRLLGDADLRTICEYMALTIALGMEVVKVIEKG